MRGTVAVALVMPVAFTAAVLGAVSWNRSAGRGPTFLTDRELWLNARSDDNSVTTMSIIWEQDSLEEPWLDRMKLVALGFSCDVDPSAPEAERYYARQLPRRAYIAFEYDGPAWEKRLARREAEVRKTQTDRGVADSLTRLRERSRLVAMDAGLDGDALARRYPDAQRYLIAAGVVRLIRFKPQTEPAFLTGSVNEVDPRTLHVPRDLARILPAGSSQWDPDRRRRYRVEVWYGRRFEPWITSISLDSRP